MTIPISALLYSLGQFEQAANAGPDREVFQAYIKELFTDGSGKLRVELASTQCESGDDRLFNRMCPQVREFTFESVDGLMRMLSDLDLVKAEHPEHTERTNGNATT